MRYLLTDLLYLSLYWFIAPWILLRRIFRGRPLGNWRHRVFGAVPQRTDSQRCLWIHAVSVGEINQLQTLLGPLQRQFPDWTLVISTTTATGMQLALKKYPHLQVFYFPIDFSWAIRNALRRIRPDLMVLTELELWPNLIHLADHSQVPIAVINGRLSANSFRNYHRARTWVRSMFSKIALVAAQDQDYADRFVELGTPQARVHVTGSIKFDNAPLLDVDHEPLDLPPLAVAAGIRTEDILWVAGSTQAPEELMVARVYLKLRESHPELRLVIVPRHPHRGNQIATSLQELGLVVVQRTAPQKIAKSADSVLLIDTIGELAQWWQAGSIAFVGGSFGMRGGQNMIEPAAAGSAVCFGPNTWNFAQVVKRMREAKVATQVEDQGQLESFVTRCLEQPQWAKERAVRARQFVLTQQGATQRTINLLQPWLADRPTTAKAA